VVEGLCDRLGLDRFVPYLFDYGAPVGFRLALRRPERIAGLVVQNGNAYDEGLSAGARRYAAARRGVPADEALVRGFLGPDGVRAMYEVGVADAAAIDPDAWALDLAHLSSPERVAAQLDLAFDYGANVASYPVWQAWLRRHRPPTLIAWGRHDEIFLEAGARAYLQDVPDAELHLLDTGHSALATHAHEVAPLVADLLDRAWARPAAPALSPPAPSGTA
jgi:pimeloyl-ACP methyl ester carboxylesterase